LFTLKNEGTPIDDTYPIKRDESLPALPLSRNGFAGCSTPDPGA
jgi:hypothetical protein